MSCSELRVSVDVGSLLQFGDPTDDGDVAKLHPLVVDYGSIVATLLPYVAPYPCSSLAVAVGRCLCAWHVLRSFGTALELVVGLRYWCGRRAMIGHGP